MKIPSTNELAQAIEDAFPFLDMPSSEKLAIHDSSCGRCADLAKDIDECRGREIAGDAIRLVHQDLSHLSRWAWQWILPHYLRFCLTSEAKQNRMETEFLIYNLAPDQRFESDTGARLSLLSIGQLKVLLQFLLWLSGDEYWSVYCPQDIHRGQVFLETLLVGKFHDH